MRKSKRLLSLFLCAILVISCFAGLSISSASAAIEPNQKYSTDEVILQCWNWPVNTIRNKLQDIAKAGYTAVQTSPINGIIGSNNDNTVENWYQFYQPTNYRIGNKICTEEDFKSLCSEAHALGMKVLVDVTLNHTSDQLGSVDGTLKEHYHKNGGTRLTNYDKRYDQTQYNFGTSGSGLPDLDTSNETVQTMARAMLQNMLNDGADGFRFDAAKHIELPSGEEISGCPTSDYWPTVVNNLGDKFSYGEVLAGQNTPLYNYSKYMNVTGSSYSNTVKNGLVNNNTLNAGDLTDLKAGLGGRNLVCWVESHDDYIGGNYKMSNDQIKLGWAAITAQGINSVYLARPYGSSTTNMRGNNDTSYGGDSFYIDNKEVVAVNKFHNAAKGQEVSLENWSGNSKVLIVKRGSVGVCIINGSSSSQSVSIGTEMPNGTYYDEAYGGTFNVNNGTLTGTVAAEKVAAVFRGSGSDTASFYLKGSFNSWNNSTAMTKGTNGVLTQTVNLSKDTYELKINDSNGNWYGNAGTVNDSTGGIGWDMGVAVQNNCTLKASGGDYTFKFYPSTKKLEIIHDGTQVSSSSTTSSTTSATQATTASQTSTTKTIKVGVITYLKLSNTGYKVHCWGGKDGDKDVSLTSTGNTEQKSVGSSYWNNAAQTFNMYTATVPNDITGFKVFNGDKWFGSDGDAKRYNSAYVFEYGGNYLASYDKFEEPTTAPPTTVAPTTQAPTTEAPTTQEPTTEPVEATTEAPTTQEPTTEPVEATTVAPTTEAPTTVPEADVYKTKDGKEINVKDEFVRKDDDPAEFGLDFNNFKNLEILGLQKKKTGNNSIRFISVVKNDIIQDADDYGFIFAGATTKEEAALRIANLTVDNAKNYTCQGTSNNVSGDYGNFNAEKDYKYVTYAVNDIGNYAVAAKFYVKKGDKVYYATYNDLPYCVYQKAT